MSHFLFFSQEVPQLSSIALPRVNVIPVLRVDLSRAGGELSIVHVKVVLRVQLLLYLLCQFIIVHVYHSS